MYTILESSPEVTAEVTGVNKDESVRRSPRLASKSTPTPTKRDRKSVV